MCGNTSPPPCGTTPGPPPGFIFGSANCCQRKSNDGKNYHLVRLDLFSKHWKMILMNASVSLMTHTWEDVCLQSLAVDQVIYVQLCHSSCLTKDTYCFRFPYKTLPKAQRTWELSSFHKFLHKSWSNFISKSPPNIRRTSTELKLQNFKLDQT